MLAASRPAFCMDRVEGVHHLAGEKGSDHGGLQMLAGMPQKGGQRIVVQPELRGSVAHQEEPLFLRAVGGQRFVPPFATAVASSWWIRSWPKASGAESSKVLRPNSVRRARARGCHAGAGKPSAGGFFQAMCHKGDSAGNLVNILDLTVQHGHVWRAAAFPGLVCVSVPAPGLPASR